MESGDQQPAWHSINLANEQEQDVLFGLDSAPNESLIVWKHGKAEDQSNRFLYT
jgi:hypothetical protein